jgi:hypothetical protein
MSRINPLHIITLAIVVSIFFTFKLNQAQVELQNIKKQYNKNLQLAKNIDALKTAYKDKSTTLKYIDTILKHHKLKDIKKETTNSKIILKAENINKSTLNYLMSKLLNKSLNITKLHIKKTDNTHAKIEVNITW